MQEAKQISILVGVNQGDDNYLDRMDELENLAIACNIETVGRIVQNLDTPNGKYYVGKGKLEEIIDMKEETEANVIIFNAELSPSQLRDLEKALDVKIIDRTMLILEIFQMRAQTKEAQLQVAIAQLKYFLPRLVGLRASLGRQSGGVGTRNKGLGEKKIELDRRKINDNISLLEKELQTVVTQRKSQRKWRKKNNIKTVALVGYTNAGKSSIMNAILQQFHPEEVDKEVFTKDMLFATLQTTARRIDMPFHKSFLLTDTVGFVADLPHHLIEAFKSTLEEIKEADLLLHVVDSSSSHRGEMITTTNDTLKSLGAHEIPMIYVYNKMDLLSDGKKALDYLPPNSLYFSAKTGENLDEMIEQISEHIFDDYKIYQLTIPYERGDITAYYHEHVEIMSEAFEEKGTVLRINATKVQAMKFKDDILEVAEIKVLTDIEEEY